MVWWYEVEFEDVYLVLIDGFAPEFEVFSQLDLWNQRITERDDGLIPATVYYGRIRPHIRSSEPCQESHLLSAFAAAVRGLRHGWCPYINRKKPPWDCGDPARCFYWDYTSGPTNRRSLERPSWRDKFSGKTLKLIPEYENDRRRGRHRYISNVFAYRAQGDKACECFPECCQHWIDALHFEIKDLDAYKDPGNFLDTWSELLRLHRDMFHEHQEYLYKYHILDSAGRYVPPPPPSY